VLPHVKKINCFSLVTFYTSKADTSIVHFKELFLLDGKKSNLEEMDLLRRNSIAQLLADWGLVSIVDKEMVAECAPLRQIKIISHKEKSEWELCPKYNIGNK